MRRCFVSCLFVPLLLAACGGDEEVAPEGLPVPLAMEARDHVGFELTWVQTTSQADADGRVAWDAVLDLRAAGDDRFELTQPLPDGEMPVATFVADDDGRFHDLDGFIRPSKYEVSSGGVGASDLVGDLDWLQAHLRPLPSASIGEGETWFVPVVFDGVPMPLRVRFDLGVTEVDETTVEVAGEGLIAVHEVSEEAAGLRAWVAGAKRTARASIEISRADGLVESARYEIRLESDTPWDGSEATGEPVTIRTVIEVRRQ